MDGILIIVILVLTVILLVVYFLSRIYVTDDPNKIFDEIVKTRPIVSSYSLGRTKQPENNNKRDVLYENVYFDNDGSAIIKHEQYPTDFQGKPIILQPHGNIIYHDSGDGFNISGLNTKFKCPPNYKGNNCILEPLCGKETNMTNNIWPKYKLLSYSQFVGLGLYLNANKFPTANDNLRSLPGIEDFHPRIRVQCLNESGDYRLEVCPQDKLLDFNNIQCVPHDICSDRINGYKHTNEIASNSTHILQPNEYYMCKNNKSVLQTCSTGTLFSNEINGCVTQTPCFGRGSETLPINNTRYLQCMHDHGTIVDCKYGIQVDQIASSNIDGSPINRISCIIESCKPRLLTESNDLYAYNTGEITCINDVAITKTCDSTTTVKTFKFSWAENFDVTLPEWPKQVYDVKSRQCRPPDTDIIVAKSIPVRWSDAMPEEHPFNIVKGEYICNTKYRWDYMNKKLVPESKSKDLIFNTATPCQNNPIDDNIITYPTLKYPQDTPAYIIITEPAYLDYTNDPILNNFHFWPYYNVIDKTFLTHRVDYIDDDNIMAVTKSVSQTMPFGFIFPNNTTPTESTNLHLAGYSDFQPEANVQYNFIATGYPDRVRLADIINTEVIKINIVSFIDSKNESMFTLDFRKMKKTIEVLPGLFFNKKFIRLPDKRQFNTGYMLFRIVGSPNATTTTNRLIMGDGSLLSIEYDYTKTPIFTFT